ncbi:MAG: flagellar motor switch protein FliG [Actinomycetes bacterium]|jgi:flagellar motor switch protein FliG|nr:MAG: flagellar motor switch protein FliG [Actinomycetota bacterium]
MSEMTRVTDLTPTQKAAALVVAVGSENAAQLFSHLSEEEVEVLAGEVARLGEIDTDVVESVLSEVYEQLTGQRFSPSGGIHVARDILTRWKGPKAAEILERIVGTETKRPFAFVRDVDPEQLVQFLKEEHPQTVALVLAYQSPSYAAQVLSGFDPDLQREVALRIAGMGRTSPDVIEKVEAALQARLGSMTRRESTSRGGVKDLAEMLNYADRATEREILDRINEVDPQLAEQVRSLMFVFEDIASLDDRSIQLVIQAIDTHKLAVAMKGVRSDVQQAILRNMSARARETLLEEMELLGPVRRRDVEAAQTEIVARIRDLDDAGEIVISRDSGDLVG